MSTVPIIVVQVLFRFFLVTYFTSLSQGPKQILIGSLALHYCCLYSNLLFLIYISFCVYGCIFCMYVYSPCLDLLPMVFRKGCQISWNWIYRQLWDSMWVLEIEFGSSSRATKVLYCCIHPFLPSYFFRQRLSLELKFTYSVAKC